MSLTVDETVEAAVPDGVASSRKRRIAVLGVVLAVGVVVGGLVAHATGRGSDGLQSAAFVRAGTDGKVVVLQVGSCGASVFVNVVEKPDEVVVTGKRTRGSNSLCADAVRVTLSSPLGGRSLIDGTTHQPIPRNR